MAVPGRLKEEKPTLDSLSKASDEDNEFFCQPCLFEGNNVAAVAYCNICDEYICKTCLSVHRKQSATRNHSILEKDQMPKQGQGQSKNVCSEPCQVHVKEVVKFYCETHDVVGCGDCMVLGHKACKVDLIVDVSANYTDGHKQKEISELLAKFENEIHDARNSLKSKEEMIAECHAKVIAEIKAFRIQINVYLDKMESEIIEEVIEIKQQQEKKIVEMANKLKTIEEEVTEINRKRNKVAEESNTLFVTDYVAKANLEKLEVLLEKFNSENSSRISWEFQENEDVSYLLKSLPPIGTIELTKADETDDLMKKEANFLKTAELKGIKITGSAIFPPGQLAVVDNLSKDVQLLDINSLKVIATMRLENCPWDVALIRRNEIAVTVPDEKKIHFISKNSGILRETRTCTVEGECYGIACVDHQLIVSYLNPCKIELLNNDCLVLNTVVCAQTGSSLFEMPRYIDICPSTNNIYVSDYKRHTLTIFSLDGQLLTSYEGEKKRMHSPQGLAALPNGMFLVASYGSTNVKLFTANFDKTKVILKGSGLKWPLSICFYRKENKLFVCNDNGHTIDVYQFK